MNETGATPDDLDQGLLKEEKILRMLDAQVEIIPGLDGTRRLPRFRACLLHKLATIYKAWFTWTHACKRIDIHLDTMKKWRLGRSMPSLKMMERIDAEYEHAIERLRHHAALKELRMKKKLDSNMVCSGDLSLSAKRGVDKPL